MYIYLHTHTHTHTKFIETTSSNQFHGQCWSISSDPNSAPGEISCWGDEQLPSYMTGLFYKPLQVSYHKPIRISWFVSGFCCHCSCVNEHGNFICRTKRGLLAEYESTMPKFNLTGGATDQGASLKSSISSKKCNASVIEWNIHMCISHMCLYVWITT